MRITATIWVCALSLLASAGSPGYADVITLDDGSVLDGEIVPDASPADSQTIELRITAGGVQAIQHIDRRHVAHITYGPSAHQRLLTALAAQATALGRDGSAEDYLALAEKAKGAGESALARTYARAALARDRQLLAAHRLLGEVLCNGIWMLPREAAVARGELFYAGRWMSWPEHQALLAQAQASAQAAAQQRQAQVQAERQARADEALEEAEFGSSANDPVSANYVSPGSVSGNGASVYSYGASYGYGGIVLGTSQGSGGVIAPGWGQAYPASHYGSGGGGALVVSGSSHSSQWALGLHW